MPVSTASSWCIVTPQLLGLAQSYTRALVWSPTSAGCSLLAAYERELIGLVQAVRHWWPYLWRRHFLVRLDHYSLKFLLDQRLSTVPQHQWISKLFGFGFDVVPAQASQHSCKALSCRDSGSDDVPTAAASAALAVFGPSFAFLDDICRAAVPDAQLLACCLQAGDLAAPWRLGGGLLLQGSRIFVPNHGDFQHQVRLLAHSVGHECV